MQRVKQCSGALQIRPASLISIWCTWYKLLPFLCVSHKNADVRRTDSQFKCVEMCVWCNVHQCPWLKEKEIYPSFQGLGEQLLQQIMPAQDPGSEIRSDCFFIPPAVCVTAPWWEDWQPAAVKLISQPTCPIYAHFSELFKFL